MKLYIVSELENVRIINVWIVAAESREDALEIVIEDSEFGKPDRDNLDVSFLQDAHPTIKDTGIIWSNT